MIFNDRAEAGQLLAKLLKKFKRKNIVVYALPRGGVVVGFEIAKQLQVPLGVIAVKKIGHQFNPEFAIGAITANGHVVCDAKETNATNQQWLEYEIEKKYHEAKLKNAEYEKYCPKQIISGKTIIIVDDGIATGFSIQAALKDILALMPKEIIVAVPVISYEILNKLKKLNIKVLSLDVIYDFFGSVGAHYIQFPQVEDTTVISLLGELNKKYIHLNYHHYR